MSSISCSGHLWESHFSRKIAEAAARGEPVTVGDLRAWLDDPQPMGLPQEIADLVILDLRGADQPQHHRRRAAGGRERAPGTARGRAGGRAAAARRGRLGSKRGHARQAIFGIGNVSELRTARNVSLLADSVRKAAASHPETAQQLSDLLVEQGPGVLGSSGDPASTSRARIAASATGCARNWSDAPTIGLSSAARHLSTCPVPLHVGRSLATSPDIIDAAERMDWGIYLSVAEWPPGSPVRLAGSPRLSISSPSLGSERVSQRRLRPALEAADRRPGSCCSKPTGRRVRRPCRALRSQRQEAQGRDGPWRQRWPGRGWVWMASRWPRLASAISTLRQWPR